ncbi:hypothetical protein COB11_08530, partial [Candidatus Aerophobetes bacterium]
NIPYNLRTYFPQLEAFSKTALGKKEHLPPKLIKEIKDNFIIVAVKKKKLELAQQNKDSISMSTFPFLDARNILNYLEAVELDEPVLPGPTKASVFINTFKNYCASNENSFLNKVCLPALERKLASTLGSEKNKKSVIYNALKDVLGEYLGDTCDYAGLTLSEMLQHLETLERSFHDDFKESYGIFFTRCLAAYYDAQGSWGMTNEEMKHYKEKLTDINFLAEVVSKFYDPSNRVVLDSIGALFLLSNKNLRLVPPEIKELVNLRGLDLHNTQITTLPNLSQCTFLETLSLDGTKIPIDQQQSIRDQVPNGCLIIFR